MKILLLLQGAPGVGKSHWIKTNKLEGYTVSMDDYRMKLAPLVTREIDGRIREVIDGSNSFLAANLAKQEIDSRTDLGELVILDAQNVRRRNYKEVIKIAERKDYKVYMVDLQNGISLETLLERNVTRESYKYVPIEVIKKSFDIYKSWNDERVERVSPEKALELIKEAKPSKYTSLLEIDFHCADTEDLLDVLMNMQKPSEGLNLMLRAGYLERKFPVLTKMIDVPQNPEFHPEGDVWIHTLSVVDWAARLRHHSKAPETFMMSALLHDIGKIYTTRRNAKGNWSAINHEYVGSYIAKVMLKHRGDDQDAIAWNILNHMRAHDVLKWKDHTLAEFIKRNDTDKIHELLLLSLADEAGKGDDPENFKKAKASYDKKLARIEAMKSELKSQE